MTAARPFSLIPVILLVLVLAGCVTPRPETDPARDREALRLATDLRGLNRDIRTAKGTAWIRVESGIRNEKFRIAWAAETPNRLRLVILASGHPVETVLATGDIVTFVSHMGKHKPHTAVSNDPDMARYIHLPVRLSELTTLLLGQLPIREFDDAWFSPDDSERILLRKSFVSEFQEISMDPDRGISAILLRNRDESPLYELRYLAFEEMNGHQVPREITVHDNHHRIISLTITRFIPNAPLKESVFRLTDPGS